MARTWQPVAEPEGWWLCLAEQTTRRLVVFLHGFKGKTVDTWWAFPRTTRTWWEEADMLFAGYPSTKDNPRGAAARLRRYLPTFYPALPDHMLEMSGVRLRPKAVSDYEELFLVGHSLGGLILRIMVRDLADDWVLRRAADPQAPLPPLLEGHLRLFSPASAGFQPAGLLGLLRVSRLWRTIELRLRMSSAYTELQPGSLLLDETQRRTEELIREHAGDLASLRAHILWASPDEVVPTRRYQTDYLDEHMDGKNHSDVCKPDEAYAAPWVMVETGKPR